MRHPRTMLAVLASSVVLGTAEPSYPQELSQPPSAMFRNWDRNGDGKLTREELPDHVRQNFDRADTDRDGFITPAEERSFRQRQARPAQAAAARVAANLDVQKDIPYANIDNPRQKLDLYLPKNRRGEQPLPVIVWIHGGAWLGGDKASGAGQLARFVRSGDYAGVSVAYRLTNEATWPAQIHDCKAAIRWIRGNAEKYGLDPQRIGVWGNSAGGHLVAMLGTSGAVESLEGTLGEHTKQSSRVACVSDYYGPSDLLTIGDYPSAMDHKAADSPESKLVGGKLLETQDVARSASPVTFITKDDPPFLIVHGNQDMTVPYNQSERLEAALRESGVDVTFVTVDGGEHGGFVSPELDQRVAAFFDRHLRGKDVAVRGGVVQNGRPER